MTNTATEATRVLFVCLGNICRSPMAQAVFQHHVQQAGLAGRIEADSAGTGAYHIGEPPHPGTMKVLRERGIAYHHAARIVTPDDFEQFDYIVALDRSNLSNLRALERQTHAQVLLLLDLTPDAGTRDVPDPYYTGGFSEVYALIERASRALLEKIVAERRMSE